MSTRGLIVRVALTAVLIGLLWGADATAAIPSQEAVVKLSPPELDLKTGDVGYADVVLENAGSVYRYQFTLLFDPSRASVVDEDMETEGMQVEAGDFLSGSVTAAQTRIDNGRGRLEHSCSLLGEASGREGRGTLGRVALKSRTGERIGLNLSNVRLTTHEGRLLPVRVEGGLSVPSASGVDQLPVSPRATGPSGEIGGLSVPVTSVPAVPSSSTTTALSSLPGLLTGFSVLALLGLLVGNRMQSSHRGNRK